MTTVNISLPNKMARQIDRLTHEKGYASRSELVRDLLREKLVEEIAPFQVFEKRPLTEIRMQLAKTGRYNRKFIDSLVKGLKESSLYAASHHAASR